MGHELFTRLLHLVAAALGVSFVLWVMRMQEREIRKTIFCNNCRYEFPRLEGCGKYPHDYLRLTCDKCGHIGKWWHDGRHT